MKAVCMVAHPDDCVIFAYSLMHNFAKLDWSVVYLTYHVQDERAQEFVQFWGQRGVSTDFLGFRDDYRDIELGEPSFDTNLARNAIHDCIIDADVVLTHDTQGDYGHPHHRFVNRCVQLANHDHVIMFAPPGQGTHDYEIDSPDYDRTQLPLHFDAIKGFHQHGHRNSYSMTVPTHHRISYA